MRYNLRNITKLPYSVVKAGIDGTYENAKELVPAKKISEQSNPIRFLEKYIVGAGIGTYLQMIPHELLHLLGEWVTTGYQGKIYFPKYLGGSIYEKISTIFTSQPREGDLTPFFVKYLSLGLENSPIYDVIVSDLLPYLFTPAFVYLVRDGWKKKKPIQTGIGISGLGMNLGGIFLGDHFRTSLAIVNYELSYLNGFLQALPQLLQTLTHSVLGLQTILQAILIGGFVYKGSNMLVENLPKIKSTIKSHLPKWKSLEMELFKK